MEFLVLLSKSLSLTCPHSSPPQDPLQFCISDGDFLIFGVGKRFYFFRVLPLLSFGFLISLVLLVNELGSFLCQFLGLSLLIVLRILHFPPTSFLNPLLSLLRPRSRSLVISPQQISPDQESCLSLLRPIFNYFVNAIISNNEKF